MYAIDRYSKCIYLAKYISAVILYVLWYPGQSSSGFAAHPQARLQATATSHSNHGLKKPMNSTGELVAATLNMMSLLALGVFMGRCSVQAFTQHCSIEHIKM